MPSPTNRVAALRVDNGQIVIIGSPYGPPPPAALVLDTGALSAPQSVERLLAWLAPELDSGKSSS
ncbi:hypothetical protein [Pseudomonas sp. MIACH]|uniref:hypothetical protein n=1 Tax=Pseudomonas sp. MIACH TaxID=1078355 RepID=UPI0015A61D30|nr:hypothetical protein [Pseudomonas sp. MIACH]